MTSAVATAPVRSRTRAINVEAPAPAPTIEMKAQLETYVRENAKKNAATSAEGKAAKELHKLMLAGSLKGFSYVVDGASVDVAIAPGTKEVIDLDVLEKLVDAKTFRKIIKATKGDVEEHAGKNVVLTATKTLNTPEDIRIKITRVKASA